MDSSGLDDIHLTPELCRQLYTDGIIYTDKPQPVVPDATVVYQGKNRKNILIAIDLPAALRKEESMLLENLLKACDLTLEDVALVNVREQEASVAEVLQQLAIKKAIFFGVPSLSIGLPLGDGEERVIIYDGGYFIKTSPLGALQSNVSKKKALWTALKNMFEI